MEEAIPAFEGSFSSFWKKISGFWTTVFQLLEEPSSFWEKLSPLLEEAFPATRESFCPLLEEVFPASRGSFSCFWRNLF